MKNTFLLIIALVIIGGALIFVFTAQDARESEPRENDGQNGVVETPTSTPTGNDTDTEIPADIREHIESKADLIRVDVPEPYATVTSPLTVTGVARGNWYFEATFPIDVVDWNGLIIGQGFAEATDDWMTTEFVPFEGTVTFEIPEDTPFHRGTLIIRKSNASGLPEHDDALEIPIRF